MNINQSLATNGAESPINPSIKDEPIKNQGRKRSTVVQCSKLSIQFPFEPYEAQKIFMSRAIDAMESSTNALLESPTGTGKTLCLLCSTLAWRKEHDKQRATSLSNVNSVNVDYFNRNKSGGTGSGGRNSAYTTVIYASRTHSQLQQVVSELKSSVYAKDVELTILGSRDQLCSNTRIRSKHSGTALTNTCNNMASQHKCPHKNKFDNEYKNTDGSSTWLGGLQNGIMKSSFGKAPVMDVEELVSLGQKEEVCSYFHSRAATRTADLILMPYNYLFERRIQKSLSIDWNNSVVVIDEAHNVESAACASLSKTFSSADMARVIEELKYILRTLQKGADNPESLRLSVKPPDKKTIVAALKAVFEVERRLDSVPLSTSGVGPLPSCHYPAEWLAEMFVSAGFSLKDRSFILEELDRGCDLLAAGEIIDSTDGKGFQHPSVPGKEAALVKFVDLLYLSTPDRNDKTSSKYHKNSDCVVYICEGENKSQKSQSKKTWLLNFWCFSAGKALKQLKQLGVRSLLLASGTLSPMDALKADFNLPFPVELENKHVIRSSQVWVSVVGKGPNGGQLNSTVKFRGLNTYKDELGLSIVNICLTMMGKGISKTPVGQKVKGGVLVFFPTYSVMEDCVRRWKDGAIWKKLESAGGAIFVEPRGGNGGASNHQPKKPASLVGGPPSKDASRAVSFTKNRGSDFTDPGKTESFDNFIGSFESAVRSNGNALLLAVCQGKVSEGIDFANEKGRAVIVTGIPYAPIGDAWIILKRQYLDERVKGFIQPSAPSSASSGASSGRDKISSFSASSVYGNGTFNKSAQLPRGRAGWSDGMNRNQSNASLSRTAAVEVIANPASSTMQSEGQVAKQTGGNHGVSSGVSGESWYCQTASRAVNQAFGRIIRHKDDWGAIFLLDDRFERESQRRQLSSWIRPRVQKPSDFSQCLRSFREFLNDNSVSGSDLNAPLEIEKGGLSGGAPSRAPIDWDRQKRKRTIRDSNVGNKKVTVNLDLLPYESEDEENGISFINPEFFLSQQLSQQPSVATCEAARRKPDFVTNNEAPAKSRSMSEMLKSKKHDPFAILANKSEASSQRSSSMPYSSHAKGAAASDSLAHDLYLRASDSRSRPVDCASDKDAKTNVFDIIGGAKTPWTRIEEAPKAAPLAASALPARQQQTLHAFMRKRSTNSPSVQSENTPTNACHKMAKKSPDSQSPSGDPLDLDDIVFQAPRAKTISNSVRGAKIVCGVCRQRDPNDACAARACGHICCKSCWVSWLRVNQSCPLCKVSVTEDSIRGLSFT